MTEITYEKWSSSDAQREVHFFIAGTDIYLWGYNPAKIDEKEVERFLYEQGFEIKGERKREKQQ